MLRACGRAAAELRAGATRPARRGAPRSPTLATTTTRALAPSLAPTPTLAPTPNPNPSPNPNPNPNPNPDPIPNPEQLQACALETASELRALTLPPTWSKDAHLYSCPLLHEGRAVASSKLRLLHRTMLAAGYVRFDDPLTLTLPLTRTLTWLDDPPSPRRPP